VWYTPNNGGSILTARSIASGLEAHIAAGKVELDSSPFQRHFYVDSNSIFSMGTVINTGSYYIESHEM